MVKIPSNLKWSKLKPKDRYLRILSLKVLTEMRSGKSLTKSSKEYGLDKETAKIHLGSAIRKAKNRRWVSRKTDRIQRGMVINERGLSIEIIVTNSKDASLIGQYHSAVRRYLETGDKSILKKFKRRVIKDAKGKRHKLETSPKTLFEIAEAREDEEFYDIYGV
ncbi:MAG: hypothetical protein HY516_02055 [Candidatus Aenigmarchaeota archaeon]|nr:hypothetical protein [Candidatus Aenigmarchaeota archaeon]